MRNVKIASLMAWMRMAFGLDEPREVLSGALAVIIAPTLALTGAEISIAHSNWQTFPIAALLLAFGLAALCWTRGTRARIASAWVIATLTGGGLLVTVIQCYLTPSWGTLQQGLQIAASGFLTGMIAAAFGCAIMWALPPRRKR